MGGEGDGALMSHHCRVDARGRHGHVSVSCSHPEEFKIVLGL